MPETQRPQTLKSYTQRNRYFWAGIGIALFVIIAGAVLSSYAASVREEIAVLDGQLDQLEKTRNKDQETVLIDAARQSRVMQTLLSGKIYWTQALTQMERVAQASVRLTSLQGSVAKGTILFHGIADSYAAVARQVAGFVAATGIDDVVVNSVRSTSQGIEFDGELHMNAKELLHKTSGT